MARSFASLQAVRLAIFSCLLFSSWTNAAQNVDGLHVEMLSDNVTPFDVPSTYYAGLHACPDTCGNFSSANWDIYSTTKRLDACNKTMLLDFSIHAPIRDDNTVNKFLVCTPDTSTTASASSKADTLPNAPLCKSAASATHAATESKTATLELSTSGDSASDASDINHGKATLEEAWKNALRQLESFLSNERSCETPNLFAYANGAAVGIYIGAAFDKATISHAVKAIHDSDQVANSLPGTSVAQICGEGRNSQHVLGIAIDTTEGNLATVQKAVASWSKAECVSALNSSSASVDIQVWEANTDFTVADNNSTDLGTSHPSELVKRGHCKTKTVHSGDSCGSLAKACGISSSKFNKYNPDKDLCSTLMPGQLVCCSSGDLPDVRPKPYKNGTCATYLIQSGDDCTTLAGKNGLKLKDIEEFNNGTDGTWGWSGCNNLLPGTNICLSKGDPPMPAPNPKAVCGPTVPGTKMPTKKTDLADLNPCPLNACCNIWGNCGVSGEYCVEKRGPSKNPGTSPPKFDGCVSSCGTDITNKDDAPDKYQRVGYYESWNWDRPCANLLARNADKDGTYTHVHWAFLSINTSTWEPVVNDTYKQWADFKQLSAKKIMSFGGWGFSTDPATYDDLRGAMDSKNRDKFADNIVKFLKDEGLDGVDIDWEYPGAPDIPGIPPGKKNDGSNYLKFLQTLRSKLPDGKTLSIAAPASFWYLKSFPIDKMADELDYIVYMTYDLHGQWDVGNKYAMEGCDGGNCLRSHVNLTETTQTLAMITKAGVSTNKIFVGESSYGRSFLMEKEDCTSENCTFAGERDKSLADSGACTKTPGYISDAEINDILDTHKDAKTWYDDDSSKSDIVVWNGNWAAYMGPKTKASRRDHWKGYNFAGTIDWAVDLQDFSDDGSIEIDDDGDVTFNDYDSWDPKMVPPNFKYGDCKEKSYDTLEDLANDSSTDEKCRPFYVLQYLQKNLTDSLTAYDKLIKDDYDDKFKTYSKAVVDGAPKDVDSFVKDHGNKYFTCEVTEMQFCCDMCDTISSNPGSCTWCFKDGDCKAGWSKRELSHIDRRFVNESFAADLDWTPYNTDLHILDTRQVVPPTQKYNVKWSNESEPCPPDYSKRGMGRGEPQYDTVYWTLPKENKDKFFADLYSEVGIKEENIKFIDRHNAAGCIPPSESEAECKLDHWDMNIPVPDGYSQDDVLNPKDVISDAHGRIQDLPDQLKEAVSGLQKGGYGYNADDLVDALSLPVFMVSDALEQMQTIVDVADEIDKEKRKAIIFAFLSAILFFVPVAGEIAGSVAALAGIARIISLIGVAGDAAMDIYTVVDDPENAPLAIFNLILAPLALGDIAMVSRAASTRRGMSEDSISKLGGSTRKRMSLIDTAKGTCRK
ncbi:hypothetical protein PISL3812_07628 [Talaromyces islandicus]|uniref:chitinase n=1 Tax=Talaromyces islandicus TaxID=28573 RepID=A0A0U1M4V4_TALIS|nr:hypothetical protein PISL3812_07628 [Talaromyces islandicus]